MFIKWSSRHRSEFELFPEGSKSLSRTKHQEKGAPNTSPRPEIAMEHCYLLGTYYSRAVVLIQG